MTKFIISIMLAVINLSACQECLWDPPVVVPKPTPEDVRLCAPAKYVNSCYEQLGYRIVDSCQVEDQ